MNRLIALGMPTGAEFVDALRRIWDDGDAAMPIDLRAPAIANHRLMDAMQPSMVMETETTHSRSNARPVEAGDALVMATSGTTGEPKGVVLTHDSIAASALATSAHLGADPASDKWLSCLPLNHIGGLSVITRALATGTPFEILERFEPAAVEAAAHDGCTLVSMVPTMLTRSDPTPWRRILLGGSAMPSTLPANTVASYGMTETGSGVVYDYMALDGVELETVDGELLVRGPMLLRSYRNGHDPKDAEGWFATGDAGHVDDDGRVEVYGRIGDMIITGGENVWPAPVERLLMTHPEIQAVVVLGRPDPEWGQRVTAVIATAGQAKIDLNELRDLVKAELPAYCAPHGIEYVDAFERTQLGKIRRDSL